MRSRIPATLSLLLLGLATPAAWGHYNMLLPDKHSVKKGETVTFTYQWGHPFEHELFDAPAPKQLLAVLPNRKRIDLLKSLEKLTLPSADGKKVAAYRFRFTPEERGDYTFYLETTPVWMEEDKQFVQDGVKVVLHVQAEKGWDAGRVIDWDLEPITRPYGILPGMVFQAEVNPTSTIPRGVRLPVEIERYNSAPPKRLPPEEYITRTARTDPSGVVTCTLTEPGWWSLTVSRVGDPLQRDDGQRYPLRERRTLWVYVDEKVPLAPEK